MKFYPLLFLQRLVTLSLSFASLNNTFGAGIAESNHLRDKTTLVVSASTYCNFLNNTALLDQNHLYQEIMGHNASTASIVRLGNPGSYTYHLIEGRENLPIFYLAENDKISFCNWAASLLVIKEESNDPFLASNRMTFQITQETLSLSLFPFSSSFSTQAEVAREIETISILAIFFGEVRLRGRTNRNRPSSPEYRNEEEVPLILSSLKEPIRLQRVKNSSYGTATQAPSE